MRGRDWYPAITIVQPWAWLIVHGKAAGVAGGKDVENRSWTTRYRGPIMIHAGAKLSLDVRHDAELFVQRTFGVQARLRMPRELVGVYEAGGIIGKAELVDVRPPGREPDPLWPWHLPGYHGFVLQNVEPLPFRPCKGALSLWGRWRVENGRAVPVEVAA